MQTAPLKEFIGSAMSVLMQSKIREKIEKNIIWHNV